MKYLISILRLMLKNSSVDKEIPKTNDEAVCTFPDNPSDNNLF